MVERSALALLAIASIAVSGCGGAGPLLHPAHVLTPGKVTVGAGVAGRLAGLDTDEDVDADLAAASDVVEDFAIAPGLSPWASGRVGIVGDNEAGLTYTGRAFRVDARHAFDLGPLDLSLGLGGSALIPRPRGGDADLGSVYGGGGDLPILFGWKSDAELYAVWFGPRAGFEIIAGRVIESEVSSIGSTERFVDLSGRDFWFGGVAGAKVGFRSIHVAFEIDVAYHLISGEIGASAESGGGSEVEVGQLSISPGAAIILSF